MELDFKEDLGIPLSRCGRSIQVLLKLQIINKFGQGLVRDEARKSMVLDPPPLEKGVTTSRETSQF